MSDPSFAQLFRRSRYSRSGPLGNGEQDQERREIFAVAAVGFALKHDAQFKKIFLKKFAGIDEGTENYEPSLQPADCIDLELKNRDKGILVAIEFKVGAKLQDHQNPWKDGKKPEDESLPFWNVTDKGKGYGYQLRQKNYEQFPAVYYITVQQNSDIQKNGGLHNDVCDKAGKTFFLKSRTWETLLEPRPRLEEDLVNSLGELGIEELDDWRMKTMKIEPKSVEECFNGGMVMDILLWVSKKLKSSIEKEGFQHLPDENNGFRYLGIWVKAKHLPASRRAYLNDWSPWVDYVSESSGRFQAEVWFYCGDGKKPQFLAKLKKEFGNEFAEFPEPPEADNPKICLRVRRSQDSADPDGSWFCKALGIEGDK
jgi:hypothetical protein